ncbi:glycosyltransferase family 39 protein [Limnoglobus roseus]|uniref:Putative glycosyltransferase n=1 Tax=Limnoglobus roseus TaxID=2598579 RepID=A0A5C1AE33_9BACT|nr:glycosyltransferase family 39 protein [Limnoglobus roseus]QEL16513.1 putative glycosyltransferase [Limnoglobus roseus]
MSLSVVEPLTVLIRRVAVVHSPSPASKPRLRGYLEPLAVGSYLVALTFVLLRCAALRRYWFDELFTLHLARSPQSLWSNLASGLDNNPPLSYLLTALSVGIFGEVEWAVRLPAVLGAVLSGLCLYLFVRHRRGPAEAFLALSIVTISPAVWAYFLEARPYGLAVGFTASALLAWQRGWKLTFAASCVLGLSSHYFFVVPMVAFGLAELIRTAQNRKLDRGMAAGFVAVIVTLAALYPLWGYGPQAYAAGFWSKVKFTRPAVESVFQDFTRKEMLPPLAVALIVGIVAGRRRDEAAPYPLAEAVALAALAAGPIIGVAVGAKVTGAFYYRYVLPSVLGFGAVFAFAVSRAAGGNRAAVLLAAVGFVWCGLVGNAGMATGYYRAEAANLRETADFLRANADGTTIVESPFEFARWWHYEGQSLPVAFLADVDLAMKHTKSDTVDRGLYALARISDVPLLTPDEAAAKLRAGERLHFYGPDGGWRREELQKRGVVFTEIAKRDAGGTLYRLSLPD